MNSIITGASQGIGRALALKFAANGYSLFLCARHEGPLAKLAREISGKYPAINVRYKTCDVSSKDEVTGFASWVLEKTNSIDVLVNNAGSFIRGQVHDEEDGVLEQLMRTNVYSAYYLSRELLPSMIKHKKG